VDDWRCNRGVLCCGVRRQVSEKEVGKAHPTYIKFKK
jgi:hypothetical protein